MNQLAILSHVWHVFSFPFNKTIRWTNEETQLASWVVIEICNSSALQSNTFNIYIYIYTYIHEQNWHVESRFTLGPLQNTAFNILQHEQTIWLSMLEKKNMSFTMVLMPAMNSFFLPYVLSFLYTYTHTHTHAIWHIDWISLIYHHSLCFSQNCIWYWTDMSAIPWCKLCISRRVFCIFSCCSWVLFKKEHLQIEHALLPTIVQLPWNLYIPFPGIIHIFFLKSAALLEERQMSRRTMYFLHENGMQSWNMHLRIAVSWALFQKILHLENNLTFWSFWWTWTNTRTCLKDW